MFKRSKTEFALSVIGLIGLLVTASVQAQPAPTAAPPAPPAPAVPPAPAQPAAPPAAAPAPAQPAAPPAQPVPPPTEPTAPTALPPSPESSTLPATSGAPTTEPAAVTPAAAAPAEDPMLRMPPSVFGPAKKDVDVRERREKPLQFTVGAKPTRPDFGSEADLVSTVNVETKPAFSKKWSYSLGGYFRAPMRIGYGPRNDGTEGSELHSPPRVAGASKYSWTYTGLAPNPTASLYLTVENSRVSGNVVLTADTFFDAGYDHLDEIGGIGQAYVTLKFPEAFEPVGGLAWTVGAFSNRYGMAGPKQQSAGYYETYLFGRTHTAGEVLAANIDLSKDVEIILEHGFGAKLEAMPFANPAGTPGPPQAPWLPQQGPVPQGSNFVHHAHAALLYGDWLRVAGHYLYSWSPNDFATMAQVPLDVLAREEALPEASLQVLGGEVHLDSPQLGSAYLGYSHIVAKDILPLSDGVEVLHSRTGWGFKENYFDTLADDWFLSNRTTVGGQELAAEDDGTVQTVLFQYIGRMRSLLGLEPSGRDVSLALFGMFTHANAEEQQRVQDKIKGGAELSVDLTRHIAAGVRFDQVMEDGGNANLQHAVLSPKLVFHSNWLSREYVVLSYSRYFLGSEVQPTTFYDYPYRIFNNSPNGEASRLPVPEPDENMLALTAIISF